MREPILEFGPLDWLRLRASTMMSSYLALTRVVMLIETTLMVMMSNSDVDQGDVKEDIEVQHEVPLPVRPHRRLPGPRRLPRWPTSPARCCRSACRGISILPFGAGQSLSMLVTDIKIYAFIESVYLDLPESEQQGEVQVPQEEAEELPQEGWQPSPVEKKRSPAVFETLERALAQAQAAAWRPSSVSSPPPATCKYK